MSPNRFSEGVEYVVVISVWLRRLALPKPVTMLPSQVQKSAMGKVGLTKLLDKGEAFYPCAYPKRRSSFGKRSLYENGRVGSCVFYWFDR